MKVLIISLGLPTKKYPVLDGAFALDQANALLKQGLEIVYFSIDLRSVRQWRRFGVYDKLINGIHCYDFSLPIGPINQGILGYIGKICSKVLFQKAFKNSPPPDIIHSHFAGVYGVYLSKKYNIPLVITEHSSEMNKPDLSKNLIKKAKETYLHASSVITVSSLLADSLSKKTGIKSRVIHNIIDTSLFSAPLRKEHNYFTFVATALLSERKRIHHLIPIMKELPEYVKLIIVGDGPERSRIENLIIENALGNRVEMKGLLTREETAQVYSESDCFVLPSALETFGVVYVEAMAAGLPVIATRCGGPEDFVTEENGLLIDVDNHKQLSDAMHYMVDNARQYSSNRIKEYVQSRFSPDVIAKEIISVYTEIVK